MEKKHHHTMNKKNPIILGDHFEKFIQNEIKSGRHNSASEVIRSGLRLFEIESKKIKATNKALSVAEKSGEPIAFDNDMFKLRMKEKCNS